MICDKEASDDYLMGDDMIAYTLYVIEDKDGPFYSYAMGVSDIPLNYKIVKWVYASERKELEADWLDSQGCNQEPDYDTGNYFDNPKIWRTQND